MSCMVVVWVDISGKTRQWLWWKSNTIGLSWRGMWAIMSISVQFFKLPKANLKIQACTSLYQFQNYLGWISLWISSWVFCGLNEVWTLSLWLLTGIPRWHTLFPARKHHMLRMWPICSLRKLFICMVYPNPSHLTETLSSFPIFGRLCGSGLTTHLWTIAVLVIHRLMGKLKWWTGLWATSFAVFLVLDQNNRTWP